MDPMNGPWRVVLPVKGTARAKSRLQVAEGVSRRTLARAMALDALAAVLASDAVGAVVVVTSDEQTAASARATGALVVPDPGRGLNPAVRRGAGSLPGPGPVAVLLADVPAVRSEDVTAALGECGRYDAAFVPDAEGTGTVLLAAATTELLHPDFGGASAQRHVANAKRLDLDLPRLRRDVDVAQSLHEAVTLGVGPRTAQALVPQADRRR
jgi:2-phospho-L-lactate guanylyltransferase